MKVLKWDKWLTLGTKVMNLQVLTEGWQFLDQMNSYRLLEQDHTSCCYWSNESNLEQLKYLVLNSWSSLTGSCLCELRNVCKQPARNHEGRNRSLRRSEYLQFCLGHICTLAWTLRVSEYFCTAASQSCLCSSDTKRIAL